MYINLHIIVDVWAKGGMYSGDMHKYTHNIQNLIYCRKRTDSRNNYTMYVHCTYIMYIMHIELCKYNYATVHTRLELLALLCTLIDYLRTCVNNRP